MMKVFVFLIARVCFPHHTVTEFSTTIFLYVRVPIVYGDKHRDEQHKTRPFPSAGVDRYFSRSTQETLIVRNQGVYGIFFPGVSTKFSFI